MILPPPLLIAVLTLIKCSFSEDVEPVRGVYEPHSSTTAQKEAPSSTHSQSAPQSATAAAEATAASHSGVGDPCGPENKQTSFEATLNTCGKINTTYTQAPSVYGVQCLDVNLSLNQSINYKSCTSNINDICEAIQSNTLSASQWHWSSGGPNCTVGIWFNPVPAAQPPTVWHTCEESIYQPMTSTCFASGDGPFNVAAVNLHTLPAVGTNGSQVDSGYPSYIIVPQTYDDTYTDAPADAETPIER